MQRHLAALLVCVAVGLWFAEIRPQLEDRVHRGADGRPLHIPTYLPGDCPFYRAPATSLLRDVAPDVLSTLVVFAGYLALVSRRPALAGVLLGLAVWSKWTNLLFLPVAGVYALLALDLRSALRLSLAATPFLAALGVLNWHMFGS